MRMPRPQFRLDSNTERSFLHTFVKLKQMRMTSTDADPNYFHLAARRKCSDAVHRQKESANLNRFQFFAQGKIDILGDVRKKAERKMDLIRWSPAHAVNSWIKIDEKLSN